jgi:hypothetical protein
MKYLLLAFCVFELLMISYWQNFAGPYLSPLLLLAASLGIGALFLKIATTPAPALPAPAAKNTWWVRGGQLALYLALSYLVIKTLKTIWWWEITADSGIDKSDIIMQISVLVKRFLGHEQPYAPIHFQGYDLFPTYLPLQWLPYTITELAHKDYRWVPTLALWLAATWFFVRQIRTSGAGVPIWARLLLPVWPLVAWYTAIMDFNPMFKLTVEALIASYYLIVAVSIGGRRTVPLALSIAACMLSRYSIVFWVPLCLVTLYLSGQRRQAIGIAATLAVAFVVLYWLPFMRHDPQIFLKGYAYHSKAAVLEWQRDIDMLHSKFYLHNGLGFTSWALRFLPGDLAHVVSTYRMLHLVLCTLTIGGLLVYYLRHRATVTLPVFLLFSFKIYLAVFYSFIQIPYKYLFLVPIIVTSVLLANAFNSGWQASARKRHE